MRAAELEGALNNILTIVRFIAIDSPLSSCYVSHMCMQPPQACLAGDVQSKAERTREEILRAAARLFRYEGFNSTSMREIAREANIEAGSIYYHFDSKEKMLDVVLDIGVRRLHNEVARIIRCAGANDEPFRETFAKLVDTHLTFLLIDSDFTSANIRNYPMLSEEARRAHRELRGSYAKLWGGFLQNARDKGLLRKDISVSPIRQFILSAMNWTVEWYEVKRYPVSILSERMSRLILDGMCDKRRPGSSLPKPYVIALPEPVEPHGKAARTRSEVLRAAARVLRDRGYKATTIRQIAVEANMEAGSVYYHFKSKEKIVDEVLQTGLSDLLVGVSRVIEQFGEPNDHCARISAAISAHMDFLFRASEFTSANVRSYGMLPTKLRRRHRVIRHEYAAVWDKMLSDAQQSGAVRKDIQIVPLRQVMLGALNWTVEWFDPRKAGLEGYHTLSEFSDMLVRLLFNGISEAEQPLREGSSNGLLRAREGSDQ